MYRKPDKNQGSVYDFVMPFSGKLNEENRWVKFAAEIDWDLIDDFYEEKFDNKKTGNVAHPSRMVFGALFIQRKLGLTDRELCEMIRENPYMQYFMGFNEFINECPFNPSTLVAFRQRFPKEVMTQLIDKTFIKDANSDDDDDDTPSSGGDVSDDKPNVKPANKGTLIIDASCTPADIAFPTDLELCDKARRWTERIIDHYHRKYGALPGKDVKVRTYREKARRRFLALNKRKKKSLNKIRKELRYQLNCIQRNLGYIEEYEHLYGDEELLNVEKARLETIKVFYKQQLFMLNTGVRSVPDRIVSLAQPWVRPIVRGKAKSPTEFGAKISISVVKGYTFIDKISFDAYNEGENDEFIKTIEKYRARFGCYPARVLADKLYRSRKNLNYCKEQGIAISGPKLGRPGANDKHDIRNELREIGERNEVEGKFGTGKRKFGLERIMAKLIDTAENMICMDIFIMNLEKRMRSKGDSVSFLKNLYAFMRVLSKVAGDIISLRVIQYGVLEKNVACL